MIRNTILGWIMLVSLKLSAQWNPQVFFCDSLQHPMFSLSYLEEDTLIEVQFLTVYLEYDSDMSSEKINKYKRNYDLFKNQLTIAQEINHTDSLFIEDFQIAQNHAVVQVPATINVLVRDSQSLFLRTQDNLVEFVKFQPAKHVSGQPKLDSMYIVEPAIIKNSNSNCEFEIERKDALMYGYSSFYDGFVLNQCDFEIVAYYSHNCYFRKL